MKQYIKYNKHNCIFLISFNNYTIKVKTFKRNKNNHLKILSVRYFNKGSIIDFRGIEPKLYNENKITSKEQIKKVENVAHLWKLRNLYKKWNKLLNYGNEWTLYQKDIISN